jgi:hypothetical protein
MACEFPIQGGHWLPDFPENLPDHHRFYAVGRVISDC